VEGDERAARFLHGVIILTEDIYSLTSFLTARIVTTTDDLAITLYLPSVPPVPQYQKFLVDLATLTVLG
jgi:hypothetical protein